MSLVGYIVIWCRVSGHARNPAKDISLGASGCFITPDIYSVSAENLHEMSRPFYMAVVNSNWPFRPFCANFWRENMDLWLLFKTRQFFEIDFYQVFTGSWLRIQMLSESWQMYQNRKNHFFSWNNVKIFRVDIPDPV